MCKVLVIGDPHFKPRNRLESLQMMKSVNKLIAAEIPDITVVLGDTLDTFERADMDCYNLAIDFLRDISLKSFLILLIGNHDRKNNQVYLTNEHYFTPLEYWDNTLVVWKIEKYIHTKNNLDYKFLCIPYIPTGRLHEALNDFCETNDPEEYTCVFSHQEYKGAKLGSTISQNGDEWPEDFPLNISGHVHQFDQLQENLIYVGTPYQHGFSDSSDKQVFIFEFTEQDYSSKGYKLDVFTKKKLTLTPEKLRNFKPKPNVIYKLSLRGNPQIHKKIIQQMEEVFKEFHIEFEFKADQEMELTEEEHLQEHVSFKKHFNQKIKEEPKYVQDEYQNILSYN